MSSLLCSHVKVPHPSSGPGRDQRMPCPTGGEETGSAHLLTLDSDSLRSNHARPAFFYLGIIYRKPVPTFADDAFFAFGHDLIGKAGTHFSGSCPSNGPSVPRPSVAD